MENEIAQRSFRTKTYSAANRLMLVIVAVLSGCGWWPDGGHGGPGGSTSGDADGGDGATVRGTLTLPGTATGKPYSVRLFTTAGRMTVTSTAETAGSTSGNTLLPYSIAHVPAGTYFILGFVDVDGSGGTASTPGDYAGWYGHDGTGNPPPAANAVVPSAGVVTFDFGLVLR
jgi:hypothetical protein